MPIPVVKRFIVCIFLFTSTLSYAQPHRHYILEGKVWNEKTQEPIEAHIDIFHNSDFILYHCQLAEKGLYSKKLDEHGLYLIQIEAPGYLMYTDTVWVTDGAESIIRRDFTLTPIEPGLVIEIRNIYFHFGTTYIKKESHPVMGTLLDFFRSNPTVSFEIAGHTDDEGPAEYNQLLSQGRAESIVQYLVDHGIERSRLVAKGYGESRPVDTGITKAAKARNRRVEILVTEMVTANN